MKVDVPAASAVTRPVVALMVATVGLLLTQVPPLLGVSVTVPPTQRDVGLLTSGRAFTVMVPDAEADAHAPVAVIV